MRICDEHRGTLTSRIRSGVLWVVLLSLSFCSAAVAQTVLKNVTLKWDANTDPSVAGYCIYYGSSSSNYSSRIDTGTNTSTVISALPGGATYYFAATAYNSAKIESVPSNEATFVASTNANPILTPVADYYVNVFNRLIITNKATEPGLSANKHLTFTLDPGAPTAMRINSKNGQITYVPQPVDAGTTNVVTVRVTDDNVPPSSAAQTFTVVVGNSAHLYLGSGVVALGKSSSIPLTLTTSSDLTNLSFVLDVPTNRVASVTVQSLVPQTAVVSQQPPGAAHSVITLRAVSGQVLQGSQPVIQISFTATAGQPSAFGTFAASSVAAVQANGQATPKAFGGNGQVAFVGVQSLVQASQNTNGQRSLMLYGPSGANYVVESKSNLSTSNGWATVFSGVLTTNLVQTFPNLSANTPAIFYRARTF
ncbi:MAG: Fibronectin type domain protein [Pedosphaera sp.]|nr:Fibronectin type domain protein [Pedosphaera sp.]